LNSSSFLLSVLETLIWRSEEKRKAQYNKKCYFIMLSHLVNDKSISVIEGMMECNKNNGNRILSKPTTKAEEALSWHGTLLSGQSLG